MANKVSNMGIPKISMGTMKRTNLPEYIIKITDVQAKKIPQKYYQNLLKIFAG